MGRVTGDREKGWERKEEKERKRERKKKKNTKKLLTDRTYFK